MQVYLTLDPTNPSQNARYGRAGSDTTNQKIIDGIQQRYVRQKNNRLPHEILGYLSDL